MVYIPYDIYNNQPDQFVKSAAHTFVKINKIEDNSEVVNGLNHFKCLYLYVATSICSTTSIKKNSIPNLNL